MLLFLICSSIQSRSDFSITLQKTHFESSPPRGNKVRYVIENYAYRYLSIKLECLVKLPEIDGHRTRKMRIKWQDIKDISRMERQKLFGISIGFSFSFKYKARSAENKDISKTHTTQLLPRNWVILCLNEKRPRLSASSVSRAITTRTVRFVATQKLSFAYFLYTVNFLDNDPSSSSFPPFFLPFLLSSFNRLEVRASTVYIYIYIYVQAACRKNTATR